MAGVWPFHRLHCYGRRSGHDSAGTGGGGVSVEPLPHSSTPDTRWTERGLQPHQQQQWYSKVRGMCASAEDGGVGYGLMPGQAGASAGLWVKGVRPEARRPPNIAFPMVGGSSGATLVPHGPLTAALHHKGALLHSTSTAPNSMELSRDRPESHPPLGELRLQGKNSRFNQQSGILNEKQVCFNSLSEFLGPSKNQSSPVSGNTVVTAVSLAIGGGKLVQNSLTFAQRTEHPLTSAGWRSRVGSTGGSLGDQHKAQEETGLVSGLKDHKYHSEAPVVPGSVWRGARRGAGLAAEPTSGHSEGHWGKRIGITPRYRANSGLQDGKAAGTATKIRTRIAQLLPRGAAPSTSGQAVTTTTGGQGHGLQGIVGVEACHLEFEGHRGWGNKDMDMRKQQRDGRLGGW
eukprot:CAMPEP_0174310486 /NCGR_PEP_ID=MMETSP0810-20121108/3076_1 /TAXON_ID=73025 ORGANISM="Eutreptiella gymnastica-like, Strain CCMP1594" /NCGR_SAMPLE_ID=MMETSP0810 /ASSEMBLY_ACC=CAM_ASM_000659 /LENGTH=401 /DNA_ID=CAMNT_0015418403 /DNA_START=167 /DNA_END=1372 /DNA_ORIENTATION=-